MPSSRILTVVLILFVAAAAAAAAWFLRPLLVDRQTPVRIEGALADGSKMTFSFPARNLRYPTFAQPVPAPDAGCRRIGTIRLSTGDERIVPRMEAGPGRVEFGIYGIGNEAWNDYELFASASGPFLRRVHPPLPAEFAGVPDGSQGDWCGVPAITSLGIQKPRDDKTVLEEAMVFLAALCDRPDLPIRADGDDVREMGRLEKAMEDRLFEEASKKSR